MRVFGLYVVAIFAGTALFAQTELPPIEVVRDNRPSVAVSAEAATYKRAHDTVGFTELAAKYRANKERFVNDYWYLDLVYDCIASLPDDSAVAEREVAFFKKWAEDEPENITAQVSYAQMLVWWAWQARGSGYANTVSDEDWRLFGQRLLDAQAVVEEAEKLEFCPRLYLLKLDIAQGLGTEREEYLAILDEAVKREPAYGAYYESAFMWMLPRWSGSKGEYEKWLTLRADAAPEGERDLQYAKLVWLAKNMRLRSELVFEPGRLDWDRTKKGFGELIAKDPKNFYSYLTFLQLALSADDRDTAREMLDVIGGRFDPGWWNDRLDVFEAARAYAYSGGDNPYRRKRSN